MQLQSSLEVITPLCYNHVASGQTSGFTEVSEIGLTGNPIAGNWTPNSITLMETLIEQDQALVRNGLYFLTEHADDEAIADGFDIYDVQYGLLSGRIRRTWPREGKYEAVGSALDGRPIGVVCRIARTGKVRVITVYEDRPKK